MAHFTVRLENLCTFVCRFRPKWIGHACILRRDRCQVPIDFFHPEEPDPVHRLPVSTTLNQTTSSVIFFIDSILYSVSDYHEEPPQRVAVIIIQDGIFTGSLLSSRPFQCIDGGRFDDHGGRAELHHLLRVSGWSSRCDDEDRNRDQRGSRRRYARISVPSTPGMLISRKTKLGVNHSPAETWQGSSHRPRAPSPQNSKHLVECIGCGTVVINDERFGHLVLQNNRAHHRHIISYQLGYSLPKTAIGQKSKKRRKQVAVRKCCLGMTRS
jgi:hypothetical protein